MLHPRRAGRPVRFVTVACSSRYVLPDDDSAIVVLVEYRGNLQELPLGL